MVSLPDIEREGRADVAPNDYWAETRRRILSSWVGETNPDLMLDLGCGTGYLTNEMQSQVRTSIGVDINKKSLKFASERATEPNFIEGNAFQLPFRKDTFDSVLMADVVEHFARPEELLREVRRVIRTGGNLFIAVPAYRWLWGPHDIHGGHEDRFTASRLSNLVEQFSFEQLRFRYVNLVPLLPYFIFQRIVKRDVPENARGRAPYPIEFVKKVLISIETMIPLPVGITLIAEFHAT